MNNDDALTWRSLRRAHASARPGAVVAALSEYIDNLQRFKSLVEANDFEGVYAQMDQTNRIKDILNGLTHQNK